MSNWRMPVESEIQFDKETAIKLHDSKFWESMPYRARFTFQLFQRSLCMPWDIFHEAAEKTLGRPVFTHEFADQERLVKELRGDLSAPTSEDIVNLIPEDKRVVLVKQEIGPMCQLHPQPIP